MKYYLVALFNKESYSSIEEIQRSICRKYKLYRNIPALHITLEVVGDPDMEKLSKIVGDILKPYKKFKVEINGDVCFEHPYKSINLKIENKGYIIRLARKINESLKLHGFDVRENIDNLGLHISLANVNFASRQWSSKEYAASCESNKKQNFYKMGVIDRIELWKPINNKKDIVVKTFELREF
ncbi:2'-5' RNA ligase family protein [Clostridium sp. P21]|uniref:2'-5' RNA ligase family protein n=1 Tax=Clostridium muellerianum TaxID=2716538 RepID=A0A7Y0EEX3_9CLOT|nr:2'-5' RNA ligase family protein [Clostridium muellerianum]NMM62123.1 2'-5' RNA ligase family protein [Clostridium muellerianum]